MKAPPILLALAVLALPSGPLANDPLTTDHISSAEKIIGLEFAEEQRKLMLEGVQDHREDFEVIADTVMEGPNFHLKSRI